MLELVPQRLKVTFASVYRHCSEPPSAWVRLVALLGLVEPSTHETQHEHKESGRTHQHGTEN